MGTMPYSLWPQERALVEAARQGQPWPPDKPRPTPAQLADPDFVQDMPAIRAETIRALCFGLWDDVTVDPKGVEVWGARIDGPLDLSFGTARGPLGLGHCHFPTRPAFHQATLPWLNLSGSRLEGGLFGDVLRVQGGLFCRDGFTATETVRLLGAEIGGDLNFSGATLDGNGGAALDADGAAFKGAVYCDAGFEARGMVRLLGANLGNDFDLSGASLNCPGGIALAVQRVRIGGNVFCRRDDVGTEKQPFRMIGDASFVATHVEGVFDWCPNEWTGRLDLAHTRVGPWRDSWMGSKWDCDGDPSINLADFQYDGFLDPARTDASARIRWIKKALGDKFKPGPYEVLAAALRRAGDDRGARQVLHEKARHRVRHLVGEAEARGARCSSGFKRLWISPLAALRRLWGWVLDITTGHGYRPWRGAAWLLGFLTLGTLVFSASAPTPFGGPGLIKPAVPVTIMQGLGRETEDGAGGLTDLPPEDWAEADSHAIHYVLPPEYPPFQAVWYSLDTLVPLIDLGQERAWQPSPVGETWAEDPAGWALLTYLYLHILMGWFLSTLTVLALTGLIKRDPDPQ